MVCTARGYLIVSDSTHTGIGTGAPRLVVIHIASGEAEQIPTETASQYGLALDESSRTVYMADLRAHQIKAVDIPDRFFLDSTS